MSAQIKSTQIILSSSTSDEVHYWLDQLAIVDADITASNDREKTLELERKRGLVQDFITDLLKEAVASN